MSKLDDYLNKASNSKNTKDTTSKNTTSVRTSKLDSYINPKEEVKVDSSKILGGGFLGKTLGINQNGITTTMKSPVVNGYTAKEAASNVSDLLNREPSPSKVTNNFIKTSISSGENGFNNSINNIENNPLRNAISETVGVADKVIKATAPAKTNPIEFIKDHQETKNFYDLYRGNLDYSSDFAKSVTDYAKQTQSDYDENIANGYREATLGDITLNALQRGYLNSQSGVAWYNDMAKGTETAKKYDQALESEKYRYTSDSWVKNAVAGAMELLGQRAYQTFNPESIAASMAAAGGAIALGNAGPQSLIPEEVITVPAAVSATLASVSSAKNYQIEAGIAYKEMVENGISENTAKAISVGVGLGNAALEAMQADELVKGFFSLSGLGTRKVIGNAAIDKVLSTGNEILQEVLQESVTITGNQLGNIIDYGETKYTNEEVRNRLIETGVSSALTFGIGGALSIVADTSRLAHTKGVTKNDVSKSLQEKNMSKEAADILADVFVANAMGDGISEKTSEKLIGNDEAMNFIFDAFKEIPQGTQETASVALNLALKEYTETGTISDATLTRLEAEPYAKVAIDSKSETKLDVSQSNEEKKKIILNVLKEATNEIDSNISRDKFLTNSVKEYADSFREENPRLANVTEANYTTDKDPAGYVEAIQSAYVAGKENRPFSTANLSISDGVELETSVARLAYEIGTEESEYGRKLRLRNSTERDGSESQGVGVGNLAEETRLNDGRGYSETETVDERYSKNVIKEVSAKSILYNVDNQTIFEVSPTNKAEEETIKYLNNKGINNVHLFYTPNGTISKNGGRSHINAFVNIKTGEAWIGVNNPYFSPVQLAAHEYTHVAIQRGTASIAKFKEMLAKNPELRDKMLALYRSALPDNSDEYLYEEMFCDAEAQMNIFNKSFQETERRIVNENMEYLHSAAEASMIEKLETALNDIPFETTEITDVGDLVKESYTSYAEACGFEAAIDENGNFYWKRNGERISNVTETDIKNSPSGALMTYSFQQGYISESQYKAQLKLFSDVANMCVKQNDFAQAMQFIGSSVFTAMKANADKQYKTTYDFVSICTKTQAVIDKMSAEMVKNGRGLSKKEIEEVYRAVWHSGNPVPCPECYVFSRWVGIGSLLDNMKSYQDKYSKLSKEEVENIYQKLKADIENYAKENGITFGKAKGKITSNYQKKYNKLFDEVSLAQKRGEIVSEEKNNQLKVLEDGLKNVKAATWIDTVYFLDDSHKKVNPDMVVPDKILFDLNKGEEFATKYKKAWAFRTTQGAGYGKAITPYAEAVLGEGILVTNNTTKSIKAKANREYGSERSKNVFLQNNGELSKDAIKTLNTARMKQLVQAFIGGQRLQSTSDARFESVTDYLIATLEMQAMHSMAQVYTKVSGAVEDFWMWGYSINQSLMPKNSGLENGKISDTLTGGMNPKVAFDNREKFDSAGTITIGVNDNHIRALINSWYRDFVIPYHVSGGDRELINEFRKIQDQSIKTSKISTDYSKTQGEKILSDEVLSQLGYTEDMIEDVHKFRSQRLAILTGKGEIDKTYIYKKGNEVLRKIYEEFNGGQWTGAKLTKGTIEDQIFPNEYWDTTLTYDESGKITEDYLGYCERLGFLHKFSGKTLKSGQLVSVKGFDENGNETYLTDLAYKNGNKEDGIEPFFWKTLTDRRMYDNDKKYLPQKFVSLGYTEAKQVGEFAKVNLGSAREYNKEISDKLVAETFRTSETIDAEYLELAKDPEKNEKRLREMVDEYANKAGYEEVVFHGTNYEGKINVFKGNKKEINGSNRIVGYFSDQESYSNDYGDKTYSYYINSKDFLWIDPVESPEEMKSFLKDNGVKRVKFNDFISDEDELQDWLDQYSEYIDPWLFFNEDGGNITERIADAGYKGVCWAEGYLTEDGGTAYAPFDSSLVKSADLVTYDDSGNIIPLSERFNENNDDIRYSLEPNEIHPEVTDGLNFRDPSGVLLERVFEGKKLYETRNWSEKNGNGALPNAYLNRLIGIVQTGDGKAKHVGYWKLGKGELKEYKWLKDHRDEIGNEGTEFDIKPGDRKWVYPIEYKEKLDKQKELNSKGVRSRDIRYSKSSDVELGTLFSGGDTFASALDGLIHTQFAAENRPEIISVYKMNHGGIVFEDVLDINPSELPNVQHLHVSPPCVNLSSMNNSQGEKPIDIALAKKISEIISVKKPRAITIENVAGYQDSESMKTIQSALENAGYNDIDIDTYKDYEYGGYTLRNRVILRAMRDENLPSVRKNINHDGWGKAVGMDFLNSLPDAKSVNPRMVESLKTYNGIDPYKVTKPLLVFGESYKNKQFGHAYFDQICPTIIAESGASRVFMNGGVVKEATPELLAKIMGLGDYKLPKEKVTARRVIGNGIPAAITKNVMGPVIESIEADNKERISRGEDIKYSYAPTFYSQMERVINNISQNKLSADGVVNYLKGKGVKAEEIKWSGIEAFLEGKKSVTKAELQEFSAGSDLKIEEEIKGGSSRNDFIRAFRRYCDEFVDSEDIPMEADETFLEETRRYLDEMLEEELITQEHSEYVMSKAEAFANSSIEPNAKNDSKWSDYRLKGGTNYRELLFKLPNSDYINNAMAAHWEEEGILAHARMQDMETTDGNKMLFIDEIQSDWHNAGKRSGYSSKEDVIISKTFKTLRESVAGKMSIYPQGFDGYAKWFNDTAENAGIDLKIERSKGIYYLWNMGFLEFIERVHSDFRQHLLDFLEEADYELNAINEIVPDAPFRDTYTDYVMKRLIRMAAEEGYDSIGWTTAKQQEDRWSDEFAEGYRIEYDQDIPKFLNKYGKKWGGKAEYTSINAETSATYDYKGKAINLYKSKNKEGETIWKDSSQSYVFSDENLKKALKEGKAVQGTIVHSFTIPESMKESVLYEGQVKYSETIDTVLPDAYDEIRNDAKQTERVSVNQSKLSKVTKKFLDEYKFTDDRDYVKQKLTEFLEKVHNGEYENYQDSVKDLSAIVSYVMNKADTMVVDENYKPMRDYVKSKRIVVTQKMKDDIGDYDLFRKMNFGRTTLVNGTSTNVAEVYQELGDMFGKNYFPEDITNETDMLTRITDILDALGKPYQGEALLLSAKAIDAATDELYATLIEEVKPNKPTFANKKNDRMVEVINRANAQKYEMLRKLREQKDKQIAKILDTHRANERKRIERERKLKLRDSIAKKAVELNKILLHPTNKRYVPEEISKPVAVALQEISQWLEYEYKPNGERGVNQQFAWENIRDQYKKVIETGETTIDGSILENFEEIINSIKNLKGDEVFGIKSLMDLDTETLRLMNNVLYNLHKTVITYNKIFSIGKYEEVSEFAEAIKADNQGKSKINKTKLFGVNNLVPDTYFHQLGDTGDLIFRMLRNSQDQATKYLNEVVRRTSAFDEGVVQRKNKEVITVRLGGNDIRMTKAQLMNLYNTFRREQGRMHLLSDSIYKGGGIVPTMFKDGKKDVRYNSSYGNITIADLENAFMQLSSEEIEVCDALFLLTNTYLKDIGNKTYENVFGYKKFVEQNYWPISVDKTKLPTEQRKGNVVATRTGSMGMVQDVKQNASQPLVIGGIFDVFTDHVLDMVTFSSYTEALEDINRILNFKLKDSENVKNVIERVTGSTSYLTSLLQDIVSARESEWTPTSKLVGNLKTAAIALSSRVIIQQYTSIYRAMLSELDLKNFIKGTSNIHPFKEFEEAKKYAPIAQWKDWGNYDFSTGKAIQDILFKNGDTIEKLKEKGMYLPGKADALAWGHLWAATKAEQKAKGITDLNKVGERFTEIIDRTQVVDGVLQRSAIMRSKDNKNKSLTAFMSEPTKIYNMMYRSIIDFTSAKQQGKDTKQQGKKIVGVTVALLVSFVANAFAQSIVDAYRRPDDKDYLERLLNEMFGDMDTKGLERFKEFMFSNFGSSLNPMNYVAVLKDISSMIEGYDGTSIDESFLGDLVSSGKNLTDAIGGDGKYNLPYAAINFISVASKALGLPIENIKRDVTGITETIAQATGSYEVMYYMALAEYNLSNKNAKTEVFDILYQAYKNNKEAYQFIYKDLIKRDAFKTKTQSTSENLQLRIKNRKAKEQEK